MSEATAVPARTSIGAIAVVARPGSDDTRSLIGPPRRSVYRSAVFRQLFALANSESQTRTIAARALRPRWAALSFAAALRFGDSASPRARPEGRRLGNVLVRTRKPRRCT